MRLAAAAAAAVSALLAAGLPAGASARAHWNDPNIVIGADGWEQVPDSAWGTPHAPYDARWKSNSSTIMVLIAALRESRLPATIMSAFDNASHPERIRVGVVQQNDDTDVDCIEAVCRLRGRPLERVPGTDGPNVVFKNPRGCVEFDRVRVLRLRTSDAAGPVYARGRQPELLQNEDFCMQIDAHTIFGPNWDLDLLREWGKTDNEFAVLSTYPTNYKDIGRNSNKHWEMPHICGVSLSSSGAISNNQASAAANLQRPLIAPFWAAGLSFSRCHAERSVPNDVNLRHVFSGEEFSRAARLWTHGYDFYSITRPIIGVYYGGAKGGHGGWRTNRKEASDSLARIRTLLRYPGSDQSPEAIAALGRFGLGTRRTLEQYAEFCGVNTMALTAGKSKCIVEYVPWDDAGLREKFALEEAAASSLAETSFLSKAHSTDRAIKGLDLRLRGVTNEGFDFAQPTGSGTSDALTLTAFLVIAAVLFILYRLFLRSRAAKGRRQL